VGLNLQSSLAPLDAAQPESDQQLMLMKLIDFGDDLLTSIVVILD
jgi:hypothetical protein